MAKVKVKIPVLRFREEKVVVQPPPTRSEIVRQTLRAQQDRITQRLGRRTVEVASQPDEVRVSSTLASRFPGMLRLSRQNPEAARQLDQAAAATASSSGRGRLGLLGLLGLGLAGASAGAVAMRRTSQESRAQIAQGTGRYILIVSRQGAGAARSLGNQARGRAAAMRSRIAQGREVEIEPETVTDRVQTELGENETLRHLPRINVNTEPGGVVYLRGVVPGESERELAERIARRQRGVTEVMNELRVRMPDGE